MFRHEFDLWKEGEAETNSKRIMSRNKDVFMAMLFMLYQQQNDQHITTVNQMIQMNVPIVADIFQFKQTEFIELLVEKRK